MAVTQKTVVLNQFGLARRERTSSSGSTGIRYTVSIEAQPLVHMFDAKTLGRTPAIAIADHLRERVQSITAVAAAPTLLRRKYARAGVERGATWAMRRYSGGRTGTKAPTGSDRLFNDSGRFAEGIVAAPTRDNNWVINVTANRLDPSTFRDGEHGLMRMFVQLRQYVPEFGDANQLVHVPSVRRAIGDSLDGIFLSGLGARYGSQESLRARVRQNQLDAIREAMGLVQQLGLI